MRATDSVEIGSTGLRVTRLGLGGVALSGAPPSTDPHRPSPEPEAIGLIRRSPARDVPRDRYVIAMTA
jgi:hypothetical protein